MKVTGRIFLLLIAILVILLVVHEYVFRNPQKRNQVDINELLNINKLVQERDDIHEMHIQYLKALKSLKDKVNTIGDRITSRITMAKNMNKEGDLFRENQLWDLALKNYEIGLDVFPNDASLNFSMGLTYANLGAIYYEKKEEYWKKAEFYYKEAIRNNKDLTQCYYALAILYINFYEKGLDKKVLPEALQYINTYLTRESQDIPGFFARARIFYLLDQKKQAIETYKIILGLAKEGSMEYNNALKNIKQISLESNE